MGQMESAEGVMTEFSWTRGGREVKLTGSFGPPGTAWKEFLVLHHDALRGGHFGSIRLPPGRYQYKFVVDGKWMHNPDQKCVRDGNNTNNEVEVVAPARNSSGVGLASPPTRVRSRGPGSPEMVSLGSPAIPPMQLSPQPAPPAVPRHTPPQRGGPASAPPPASGSFPGPKRADSSGRFYAAGRPQVAVEFRFVGAARNVSVSGDFADWATFVPLVKADGRDFYTGIVYLDPGTYRYKYVVDGKWVIGSDQRTMVDPMKDDEGRPVVNNVVEVPVGVSTFSVPVVAPAPAPAPPAPAPPKPPVAPPAPAPAPPPKSPQQQPQQSPPPPPSPQPQPQHQPHHSQQQQPKHDNNWQKPYAGRLPVLKADAPDCPKYSFPSFGLWRGVSQEYDGSDGWRGYLGAVPEGDGAMFRVWAPQPNHVEVLIERRAFGRSGQVRQALRRTVNGQLWEGWVGGVCPGDVYRFGLYPNAHDTFPDPAARYSPEGPHGWSMIVDPRAFRWSDAGWRGRRLRDTACLYEMHVGTFTREGTLRAARARLADLAACGVDAVELLPMAEFPGDRNWGYDGTQLFAVPRCYGAPDDLRAFVDEAHRLRIAVYLDVVYNHFGPDGHYLHVYNPNISSRKHKVPWGAANDLGTDLRWFFAENALMWVHEYHVDGLRLDSAHNLFDDRARHFLHELPALLAASVERHGRVVEVVLECMHRWPLLYWPRERGGYGCSATWTDDFNHQVKLLIPHPTLHLHGDYGATGGTARDLALAIRRGWHFTGPREAGLGPNGEPPADPSTITDMSRFCVYIDNHDQVGNRPLGDRFSHVVDGALYRACSALLLALPHTALLFMGQEFAASSPFQFFTAHNGHTGAGVTEGRRREFAHVKGFADPRNVPDPQDKATFERSKLKWEERDAGAHAGTLRLYRDLLALRASRPAFQNRHRAGFAVAPFEPDVVAVLRRGKHPTDAAFMLVAKLGGGPGVSQGHTRPSSLDLVDFAGHPILDPRWSGDEDLPGGALPPPPLEPAPPAAEHAAGEDEGFFSKLVRSVAGPERGRPSGSPSRPEAPRERRDSMDGVSWSRAAVAAEWDRWRAAAKQWSVVLTTQDGEYVAGGAPDRPPELVRGGPGQPGDPAVRFHGPGAILLRAALSAAI